VIDNGYNVNNNIYIRFVVRRAMYDPNNFISCRVYRNKMRDKLIRLLGGKCFNPTCLVPNRCSDIRCLQLDHINGGGLNERKTRFRTTTVMIAYYLKHPDEARDNIQILCANCNHIKKHMNREYPNTPKKHALLLTVTKSI
jgi:hypothetical protein